MIQELVDVHRPEFSGLILRISTTRAGTKRKARHILASRRNAGQYSRRERLLKLAGIGGGHGGSERSPRELQRIGALGQVLGERAREHGLSRPVDSLRRELGEVLAKGFRRTDPDDDRELRSILLRDLWVVVQPDFRHTLSGYANYFAETFRDRTTEAERTAVCDWFKARLQQAEDAGESADVLHALAHWMLEYVGGVLSDGEFEHICRQTGQFVELVGRKLDLGEPGAAIQTAKQAPPENAKPLCFAFYNRGELGVLAHSDALPDPEDPGIQPEAPLHVALMHLDRGLLDGALPWVRAVVQDDPDAEVLIELREVAQRGGVYGERLEEELLAGLAQRQPHAVLDFHLEFDEPADAVHIWEQAERWPNARWHDAGEQLLEAAEEAGESDLVLAVATARADALIEQRGRENYRAACAQLVAARKAVESSNLLLDWDELFSEYEDRLEKLPALRDEAQQAGLTT